MPKSNYCLALSVLQNCWVGGCSPSVAPGLQHAPSQGSKAACAALMSGKGLASLLLVPGLQLSLERKRSYLIFLLLFFKYFSKLFLRPLGEQNDFLF